MSKPTQLNEFDEARRVLGMIDSATNKQDYMEIFGITEGELNVYREIVNNRSQISFNFRDSQPDN